MPLGTYSDEEAGPNYEEAAPNFDRGSELDGSSDSWTMEYVGIPE
eukprot:CAMPEP_0197730054 /NCGR_PEP_ID=MMETSP1434-20131217/33005_1 /TAXON_ID=265543 /ORGANISM="Minutocellus polymorphus, Strain CCMP3303" /LENGTH=44 /DNA_ID= /DNA_START= /DNA_END= /DNA_ORIENTATION=